MKANSLFLWSCCALVVAGGVALYIASQVFIDGEPSPSVVDRQEEERQAAVARQADRQPGNRQVLAEALGVGEDQIGTVGDIDRPLRDIAFDRPSGQSDPDASGEAPSVASALPPSPQAGTAPRLKGDENEQVRRLVAELSGETPVREALSSYFHPEPFDLRAYQADPNAYLQQIRPGRAFAPADPGPEVTPLESLSPGFYRILQGEQVVLRVRAEAGLPVTFYSPATGHFLANQLTTLTVAAGDDGIATATYKTGPGSLGLTDVVVASPVHSGQIQYRILVDLPGTVAGNQR